MMYDSPNLPKFPPLEFCAIQLECAKQSIFDCFCRHFAEATEIPKEEVTAILLYLQSKGLLKYSLYTLYVQF